MLLEWGMGNRKMGNSGQRYNCRKAGVGASLQMTLQMLFSLTHVG